MEQKVSSAWQSRLRSFLPSVAFVALFALIALVYFSPAIWEGRDLFQMDVAGASGTAQDVRDHYEATGETSYWTNSLFGGMPMYQIAPSYPSLSLLKFAQDLYTLQAPFTFLPSYSWLLFAMLLGFFIFMRSLRVGRLASALGAVMWAFSSYFIILIDAGHIWKLMVLAFIPPTIGGIVWSYRGRYLLGGAVTAFFASLQLMSNHIQMSYYFGFLIVFIIIAFLAEAIRTGAMRRFWLATATTALAALVSIGINSSNLYHTYQYTQQTMRGGSELAATDGAQATTADGKGGLDKAYITQWSYGKAETLTLLVPNAYGGASGYVGATPSLMEGVPVHLRQYVGQMNTYWGDQPFTAGPVYVGAFVLFLFVLGLFIVRTPLKWALLAGTLLSVALSWGHNMMWLTDLFIDYFPLYNKFRTVSSILVIAEFTIPTLAILALIEFIKAPKVVLADRLALGVSLATTLGLVLLLAVMPSFFFDFLSDGEAEMFRSAMATPGVSEILSALKALRSSVVSADAWRSVGVIALSLALCGLYAYGKLNRSLALALLGVVTLVDLWSVDKRYLNDEKFIDTSRIAQQATPTTKADEYIKQDTDPHYRVLNRSVNTFNDATTSYAHRSIGGYHAAKLSRYQDLIEHQIAKGNEGVLDMLDVRYVIYPDPQGGVGLRRRDNPIGALTPVNTIKIVDGAREEMAALDTLNPHTTAVVDRAFADELPKDLTYDGEITTWSLLSYTPNKATYSVHTDRERLFVFSEIYYPHGWHLRIDGKPAPIIRANYVLRAARIPEGDHKIEMEFAPESITTTERISLASQGLLALAVLGALGTSLRRLRRKES